MKAWSAIREKYARIWGLLDERARRLTAANEAIALGYGGVSCVHRACGLSRKTIHKGIHEIVKGCAVPPGRIRRSGAGRKKATVRDPQLLRRDVVDVNNRESDKEETCSEYDSSK